MLEHHKKSMETGVLSTGIITACAALLQGGNFTVTGYNDTTNYSVPGSSDAQTYVLYQGVDLPGSTFQRNTTANNGNCSDLATDNTTAVSVCAGQHNLCCFDSSVAGYQVILEPQTSHASCLSFICAWSPFMPALHSSLHFICGCIPFLPAFHCACIPFASPACVCIPAVPA